MPRLEADTTTANSATTNLAPATDVLTYQSIIDSANGIFIGFVERIP